MCLKSRSRLVDDWNCSQKAVELIKARHDKVLTFSDGGVEEKKVSYFRYIKRKE